MRKFWIKLRQLMVNTFLLITTVGAVAMLLIPKTNLFSKIFWVGSATTFIFIFLFFPKRRRPKKSYKDKQGYIVLKGTNEYEHRHIAKNILNRSLLPNEVVHHINGKRTDNRFINLCVMDRHQHELFHAWLDWKKKSSGRYPSFKEQKHLLSEKHNGILLEKHFGFKFSSMKPPVQHTFLIEKPKISHPERSDDYSRKLFSDLRQERNRLANEQNIPAYLVFKNFTLTEMAQQMPQDTEAMAVITGVTTEKLRLYGDHFLAVIWKYQSAKADLKKSTSAS
ncbi:MAG: HRDC domain-containing protein [Bdellovibrio sp.]